MSKSMVATPPHGILRISLRLPIWLYQLHLGWLLGNRFLLLNHVGRKSGQTRKSVIEVIKHDKLSGTYFIVSGWGNKSNWHQNIYKNPDVTINVGGGKLEVHAENIPLLEEYTRKYPMAFKELTRFFLGKQLQPGREASQRLAKLMPMVAFHPRQ